ncbi:hypothetical protein LCGC14_3084620 [marine sediment metagenome]|uniref:Uncharacterized protein n=1 Tax=marine sediment metagenome TaxID=412755 RepID=A0A0F8YJX3_9ZZZZ
MLERHESNVDKFPICYIVWDSGEVWEWACGYSPRRLAVLLRDRFDWDLNDRPTVPGTDGRLTVNFPVLGMANL